LLESKWKPRALRIKQGSQGGATAVQPEAEVEE